MDTDWFIDCSGLIEQSINCYFVIKVNSWCVKFFAIKIVEGANVVMSEQHDIICMYSYYYHYKMVYKEQLKQ